MISKSTYFRVLDIRTGEPVTAVPHISHDHDFNNWLQMKLWRRHEVQPDNAAFMLDRCHDGTVLDTIYLDEAGFTAVTGEVVVDTAVYAAREARWEAAADALREAAQHGFTFGGADAT